MYDFVIIGAGLFGSVFAHAATRKGRKCLVVDKRRHIGGNCYTEVHDGIVVHTYGPHIFHTACRKVWEFMTQFATFNGFVNRVKVHYRGRFFSFPINLMTLNQVLGIKTPEEAQALLAAPVEADNLEEWALKAVGADLYEIFIRGYTAKQWMTAPALLPPSIIQRLPIRSNFDDRYYTDPYQGVPIGGYTPIFQQLLSGSELRLNHDYFSDRASFNRMGRIVYTGRLDEYFDYMYGPLAYRSLRFETVRHPIADYQGNAVINYTDKDVPYTRTVEHKHFDFGTQPHTIVTTEYPWPWSTTEEPFYPAYGDKNNDCAAMKYRQKQKLEHQVLFGGRLATYQYMDMDAVVKSALQLAQNYL